MSFVISLSKILVKQSITRSNHSSSNKAILHVSCYVIHTNFVCFVRDGKVKEKVTPTLQYSCKNIDLTLIRLHVFGVNDT